MPSTQLIVGLVLLEESSVIKDRGHLGSFRGDQSFLGVGFHSSAIMNIAFAAVLLCLGAVSAQRVGQY